MALDTKDIFLTGDDITVLNGDFRVTASDQQHIENMLKASPGNYYQYPLVGLGGTDLISASINPSEIKKRIKLQLKADNYKPITVKVSDDFKIFIDAVRLK
tara:strand:+ start:34 stop:336 length:303 start_codon:yes stop_codon:yes gene_type:complete